MIAAAPAAADGLVADEETVGDGYKRKRNTEDGASQGVSFKASISAAGEVAGDDAAADIDRGMELREYRPGKPNAAVSTTDCLIARENAVPERGGAEHRDGNPARESFSPAREPSSHVIADHTVGDREAATKASDAPALTAVIDADRLVPRDDAISDADGRTKAVNPSSCREGAFCPVSHDETVRDGQIAGVAVNCATNIGKRAVNGLVSGDDGISDSDAIATVKNAATLTLEPAGAVDGVVEDLAVGHGQVGPRAGIRGRPTGGGEARQRDVVIVRQDHPRESEVTVKQVLDSAPDMSVNPEIDTVMRVLSSPPPSTRKIRDESLPLTVSWSAPGPLIVISVVITNCPLVRMIVPVTPEAKLIASGPEFASAARTAPRSEPAPLSARLRTVKVLGKVRPSKTSRRGTNPRGGDRRFALVARPNKVENI